MENTESDKKWIEVLEGIKLAEPSEYLYSIIETAIFQTKVIPLQKLKWIAASILILIATNIYALQQSYSNNDALYSEAIITDFSIYNYED